MIAERLSELLIEWSPLRHAPTAFLDRYDLPADVEPLCDWLYGKPGDFGWRYGSAEMVLGAAPVLPAGADLFDVHDDGTWAVLQPVAPDGEEIIDLIAWHPCAPNRWRFLRGDAVALSEGQIELHDCELDGPLRVFATPLAWMHAEGRGVCLLRETWQAAQDLLGGVPHLFADTVDLGERLEALLRYRPVPKILVEADR